jgi:DNA helicase-2/ATP-dependent DNA helicase PcrA
VGKKLIRSLGWHSRVLYVAMTRAKCFLYCTHSAQRRRWNTLEKNLITRYLYDLPTAHCQKHTPAWNANVRKWVAQVLQKPYEENDLLLEDDGSGFLSNDDK